MVKDNSKLFILVLLGMLTAFRAFCDGHVPTESSVLWENISVQALQWFS